MVVTNACAPDPRVERHARWLVEAGHVVDIFAWDRDKLHLMEMLFKSLKPSTKRMA